MSGTNRKTWISIVVASIVLIGIFAVAVVGGTAYFFSRHIRTEAAESDAAAREFDAARQRFAGQQPLIEIRGRDEAIVHRERIPAAMPATKLDTLRVLVYDSDAGKLVHVSIPFWLVRLAPSKNLSFINNGVDFDSDRLRLSVDDLERRGPGLILDHADRRNSQVLIWAE
jgi:hypothetical protein